jgi:hypothetical protein
VVASGYDKRTVATAIKTLVGIGLLVVEKGAGVAGLGGRTSLMTIRVDRLPALEQGYQFFLRLGELARRDRAVGLDGVGAVHTKSDEKYSRKTGIFIREEVKKDQPTPLKDNLRESRYSEPFPLSAPFVAKQSGLGNEENAAAAVVTAPDHRKLAKLVGHENIEQGFVRLNQLIPP